MEMFAHMINFLHYFVVAYKSLRGEFSDTTVEGVMMIAQTAPLFFTISHLCSTIGGGLGPGPSPANHLQEQLKIHITKNFFGKNGL